MTFIFCASKIFTHLYIIKPIMVSDIKHIRMKVNILGKSRRGEKNFELRSTDNPTDNGFDIEALKNDGSVERWFNVTAINWSFKGQSVNVYSELHRIGSVIDFSYGYKEIKISYAKTSNEDFYKAVSGAPKSVNRSEIMIDLFEASLLPLRKFMEENYPENVTVIVTSKKSSISKTLIDI